MKSHQSHIIRRQIMDVEIPSRKGAFELQKEMGRWVQVHFKPILEEVFDELAPIDQVIRLDKLEIDLGDLSSDNFKEKISTSLKEKLKYNIKKQLTQQADLLSSQTQLPRNVIAQQAIDVFLQQGFLPWWTPRPTLSLLLAETSAVIPKSWAQSCFQLAETKKQVLKRLVEQFSKEFIFDLATATASQFPARAIFEELSELRFFTKPNSSISLPQEKMLFWQASAPILAQGSFAKKGLVPFFENWVQLQLGYRKSELAEGLIFHAKKVSGEAGKSTFPIFSSLFSNNTLPLLLDFDFWKYVTEKEDVSVEKSDILSEDSPYADLTKKGVSKNKKTGISTDEIPPQDSSESPLSPTLPADENQQLAESSPPQQSSDLKKEEETASENSKVKNQEGSSLIQKNHRKEKAAQPEKNDSQNLELEPDQTASSTTGKTKSSQEKDSSPTSASFREASEALLAKLYKKFYANQQQNSDPTPPSKSDLPEEGVYVSLAGLVLIHPFLTLYLLDQKLIKDNQFADEKAKELAVYHLAFLATGKTQWEEHQLLIPKLLCGIPFEQALEAKFELPDEAKVEADKLLNAAIQHWGALGTASPDGLREGFLMREGRLRHTEDNGWMLKVERQTMDVLLGQLPWGLGYVKLPWLTELVRVEWTK